MRLILLIRQQINGIILPVVSQIIFATAFGLLNAALFLRSGTLWIPILIYGGGNLAVQIPVEMSVPEFIISTLMSTIPLLVAELVLLRKVEPDKIARSVY